VSDGSAEYGLVMPFVAVASKGGPYDDDAYCAGWECGAIDQMLADTMQPCLPIGAAQETQVVACPIVREANLAQLDLVAMRHGFVMRRTHDTVDGWCAVEFTRGAIPDV
jgi:hypothetical protein